MFRYVFADHYWQDGLQATLGSPEWRALGIGYWNEIKGVVSSNVRSRVRDGLGWVQLKDEELVTVGPMPGCVERERLEQYLADTRYMSWVQRYTRMEDGKVGLRLDYNAAEFEKKMEGNSVTLVETGGGRIQSFSSAKNWRKRFEGRANWDF